MSWDGLSEKTKKERLLNLLKNYLEKGDKEAVKVIVLFGKGRTSEQISESLSLPLSEIYRILDELVENLDQ